MTTIMESRILDALEGYRPDLNAANRRLEPVQENVFRLDADAETFFVKWIDDADRYGLNELRINQARFCEASDLAPRFVAALRAPGGCVALWEWLDGTDLRGPNRICLADAFARLGHFHYDNQTNGPVVSPTTLQVFDTPHEMLQAEIEHLSMLCPDPDRIRRMPLVPLLEQGYVTLIHGDAHPGNVLLTPRGLRFVDWGYALNSLSLFDLDYIRRTPLIGDEAWWIIGPAEASDVLHAYFDHCGFGGLDVVQTHWAVTVWAILRSLHNSRQSGDRRGAELCLRNIDLLLQ